MSIESHKPKMTGEQKHLNDQLWLARRDKKNEKIQQLLDEGADINYERGLTVLGVAAQYVHTDTVQLLISRQELDINQKDMNVCYSGNPQLVRFLLKQGLSLSSVNDMNVCYSGNPQLVRFLLKQGLSLSSVNDMNGWSVMYMA